MSNPRRANGHRRDQVRRRVLAEEDTCWLCLEPVDKTLPPFLDGSPEVDEIVPVGEGGSPIDRDNCRLSHRLCNVRRGQETKSKLRAQRAATPLITTRNW